MNIIIPISVTLFAALLTLIAYFKDRGSNFFSGTIYAIVFLFSMFFTVVAWIGWLITLILSK